MMGKTTISRTVLAAAATGALALTLLMSGSAADQAVAALPGFDWTAAAGKGWSMEQGRSARWELAQMRKMNKAVGALLPQRPGTVDAYVISIGLDSDAVFGREASEAGKVLSRRYGAAGRTIVLKAGSGEDAASAPQGSPANLDIALAAVAARMNLKQDVLVLYATTHGSFDTGLAYKDGEDGYGMIAPKRLATVLAELGIERRLIILSACFSGIFLAPLDNEHNITVTAASEDRTSFGCLPSSDWTFFGDALVNNALRKPQVLDKAVHEAFALIGQWEKEHRLYPSLPQIRKGAKADLWLGALESRMPKTETAKVGRPATSTL